MGLTDTAYLDTPFFSPLARRGPLSARAPRRCVSTPCPTWRKALLPHPVCWTVGPVPLWGLKWGTLLIPVALHLLGFSLAGAESRRSLPGRRPALFMCCLRGRPKLAPRTRRAAPIARPENACPWTFLQRAQPGRPPMTPKNSCRNNQQRWRGWRPKVIDGTSFSLPDTPKNQRAYPQSGSQKPGCGFPWLRLVGVFSLSSGPLLDSARGNKTLAELRLLFRLLEGLRPGTWRSPAGDLAATS